MGCHLGGLHCSLDGLMQLKTTPLNDLHIEARAKMGEFAGWSMPLFYPLGVMKEHLHTRDAAGLFDISHMVQIELQGAGAAACLDRLCPLAAGEIPPGTGKYTFMLTPSGGIIDDLIVTHFGDGRYLVVANAGCAEKDLAHIRAVAAEFDVELAVLPRAFVALQGPQAEAVLADLGLDLSALSFLQVAEPRPGWFVSRSGYTGEDGFEIAMPAGEADGFARSLLADQRVAFCGLGARDSLRLEAGLCLYGQDLAEDISPIEASLLWAVPKQVRESGSFIGAEAFRALRQAGRSRARVGLQPEGRAPVRGGAKLLDGAGMEVGFVSSGGFGPSAGAPVAMGYVPTEFAKPGTSISADVRGKSLPCTIVKLPFVPHRYKT